MKCIVTADLLIVSMQQESLHVHQQHWINTLGRQATKHLLPYITDSSPALECPSSRSKLSLALAYVLPRVKQLMIWVWQRPSRTRHRQLLSIPCAALKLEPYSHKKVVTSLPASYSYGWTVLTNDQTKPRTRLVTNLMTSSIKKVVP